MTDNEINARVAALRDDTIEQDADGWYVVGENGHRWPPPDYCNDPAAWGALLSHLGRRMAQLSAMMGGNLWQARMLKPDGVTPVIAEDSLPGRALALAALRAYGVEV